MKKINFNGNWVISDGSSEGKEITLPYDAMIHELRSADCPTGPAGGFFPGGKYKYSKKFIAPEGKKIVLEFEGVYGICDVSLNGKHIAKNRYGYNNFFMDIGNNVRAGENLLEVDVDNSKVLNSRWYSGSGIYRDVWLYVGDDVCIKPDGLRISTPEIESKLAKIELDLTFTCAENDAELIINTVITDKNGKEVHNSSVPYTVFEKGEQSTRIVAFIKNPELWNVDRPSLYNCVVNIIKDGKAAESDGASFGIRKIQTDPVNGLRINGEKMLLRGACIHHDNGVLGANEYYDASFRRIKILKEAGFNAIRISHQPCSKPMLTACDRLGMLVLEETFDMWEEAKNKYDFSLYFKEDRKTVLANMVAKDYNHPCVIMYSIGNEIPEIVKPNGKRISRELSEFLRRLDNTRPVTNAINGLCATTGNTLPILLELGLVTREQVAAITGDPDSDNATLFGIIISAAASGNVNDAMTALADNLGRVVEHKSVGEKLAETVSHLDVCGYNYMKARYAVDARNYPDRVLLGTETMPPDIDLLWEEVTRIPQLIGDFTWTGWDYIGEAGVGHTNYEGKSEFACPYPGYLAYCGDIDITGYRRPMSYLREIVFGLRKEPYLSVQHPEYYGLPAKTTSWAEPETIESWTFNGYEGKRINVKVYADADEVALFVNEKEVGRKQPRRMRVEFDVVYEKGEIKAVAYKDGKQYAHTVKTAGESDVVIKCNKQIARGELCFMEFERRDKSGTLDMDNPLSIELDCSEKLRLLGFGTADPCATDSFFDNTHTTFNGRALAVLRAEEIGNGQVTVVCNGKTIKKIIKIV